MSIEENKKKKNKEKVTRYSIGLTGRKVGR